MTLQTVDEVTQLRELTTATLNRVKEEHRLSREVLFGTESFVIGVLQAVSGGSLVAAISQITALESMVGRVAVAGFITILALALAFAIAAAFLKHQCKMWDVKAGIERQHSAEAWAHLAEGSNRADPKPHILKAIRLSKWSRRYLSAMRRSLWLSVISLLGALALLVYEVWNRAVGSSVGRTMNEFILEISSLNWALRVALVGAAALSLAHWLYSVFKKQRVRKQAAGEIREAARRGVVERQSLVQSGLHEGH